MKSCKSVKEPSAQLPGLSDGEIETVDIDRRSFFAKIGVRSSLVLAAAVGVSGCGKSDKADVDTQTDFDFGLSADPFNRKTDPVDSDG